MLQRRLAQFLAVVQVVGIIGKARLPVIAALDDVLGDAWEIQAGQAGNPWLQR